MSLVTWSDVVSSPEYATSVQQIQAALGRQFRAVPSAAPEMRQAAMQEGARLSKLRDLGATENVANRRLDIQQQALQMEKDDLQRYARRLPYANIVGLGSVVVGGLSAYGNLAAVRRSEARAAQGKAIEAERYQATAQGLQGIREQQQRQADAYRKFAAGFPPFQEP